MWELYKGLWGQEWLYSTTENIKLDSFEVHHRGGRILVMGTGKKVVYINGQICIVIPVRVEITLHNCFYANIRKALLFCTEETRVFLNGEPQVEYDKITSTKDVDEISRELEQLHCLTEPVRRELLFIKQIFTELLGRESLVEG